MIAEKKGLQNWHKDILWTVLVCAVAIATNFVYDFSEIEKISYKIVVAGVVAIFVCLIIIRSRTNKDDNRLLRAGGILGICMLIYTYLLGRYRIGDIRFEQIMTILSIAFCVLALVLLWGFWCESEKNDNVVYYLLILAFLIRFLFFSMAKYDIVQNDVGEFADNFKHLGYIRYIFLNGTLPNQNPMTSDQFCHPPLHHFISALFLKLCQTVGFEQEIWVENLQTLPFIYSNLSLLVVDKIARTLKMDVNGRTTTLVLAAFLPYNVILSGALNNDALLFLLMLLAIYFTLQWYAQPKWCWIICMAFSIGLAMMTKISGALIAPAVAFLMINRLWKNRKEWKTYFIQFLVFGLISFPLGLWYSVFRYIQYGMPLGFVVRLPLDSYQYIGEYEVWERFIDFSNFWSSPVLRARAEFGYIDHNILTALIKDSLFFGVDFHNKSEITWGLGWLGLIIVALLFIGLTIGFICFQKDKKINVAIKIFMSCSIITIFVSYVGFCLECPHVCTMHVRYVFVGMYMLMLMFGMELSHKMNSKLQTYWIRGISLLYSGVFLLLMFSLLNVMQGVGSL